MLCSALLDWGLWVRSRFLVLSWLVVLTFATACSLDPPGLCSRASDCSAGSVCTGGVCTGCASNLECENFQNCSNRLCVNQAGRCTFTSDCNQGYSCDATKACQPLPGTDGGTLFGGGGGSGSANCAVTGATATNDVISVQGTAGRLGNVSYTVYGLSYGGGSIYGFSHDTFGTLVGTPQDQISKTSLGLRSFTPAQTQHVYVGDNSHPFDAIPPFIDISFPLFTGTVYCPASAGTGSYVYSVYAYPGDGGINSGVTGTFQYRCPDAGIDVAGCFRYPLN